MKSENSGGSVLRTTYTSYDSDGNVISTTDGNGNVTSYTYNALNRQTSSTNPLGKTTSYTYDGDGNLLTETEPSGAVITNTYNADDELTGTSYSDGTHGVSYAYNDLGQKTGMVDGTGTSSWTYNSLGQETSYTNGAGSAVQYGYDLAGNQTTITYPSGASVTQTFNATNEITAITDWNSKQSAFAYDPNGNLLSETLPNGVVNSYTYDQANNLASIADASGSTTIFSATYIRNADNLVTGDTSQSSTGSAYQYTGLSQVCYAASGNSNACSSPPSGATAYAYDAAGNLIGNNGTQQAFNAGDELCWSVSGSSTNGCSSPPSGATNYGYGANGNLTAITPPTGSASALTYNAANELMGYQVDSGASSTYAYDGNGLRQSKTTGTATTQFAWNDSGTLPLLLQETTGSNVTSYVYGPTGLPLEEVMSSAATYDYSQDNLGSTRALTDFTGALANTYSYDPYGNVVASTGSIQNNLLYCGQYMDAESGLYYLQARYYDLAIGQFLSVDPLVQLTQMPYSYTAGDPINAVDLTGLCSWFGCVTAAIGTVGNFATNACLRDPFAGNPNSNAYQGCETAITPTEGAIGVGVGATVLSGGSLAGFDLIVLDVGTTGDIAGVLGVVSSGLDIKSCVTTHEVSTCIAAALSIATAGGGAYASAADWAKLAQWGIWGVGGISTSIDIASFLEARYSNGC